MINNILRTFFVIPGVIAENLNSCTYIIYESHQPDKYKPDITWSVYGLPECNKICVVAHTRGKDFYKMADSWLIYPSMYNRIFGIAIEDSVLAERLSNEIYEEQLK